jgi:hypothetical protein
MDVTEFHKANNLSTISVRYNSSHCERKGVDDVYSSCFCACRIPKKGYGPMKEICTELAKEYEELDAIVAALDESGWSVMTPAEGWTVKDQIRHLAY